jgi:hypothetical protein
VLAGRACGGVSGPNGSRDRLSQAEDGLAVIAELAMPVITRGAETMNTIFNQQNQAKSACLKVAIPRISRVGVEGRLLR